MKTLTLVVTFNEADNIGRLVPEILRSVTGTDVLVVDDNSPDGTAEAVRRMAAENDRVMVICRTNERGYGSAMIAGMRYAIEHGYEALLTLDADFSHDPADLPRLLDALNQADVSVGSRYYGGVRVLNWEVRRLLLSLAANTYVRVLTGLECVDCTSGFRGYRTSILRNVPLESIRTSGYAFLPELLFTVGAVRVSEVPICYTERRLGESKMSKGVIAEALVRPWALFTRRLVRRLAGR